ncbi:MAG: NADH-dependent alcohol dehydrogenase [Firmicutes bacterium HGW-Firmicutes-16]|nr:MAG: NADH-dependent alcohol dehydrogenase [Firmicutes bacterium HGW-Firmicutes-16]
MKSFQYRNHTRIVFGEGALNSLADELRSCEKNILLAYGKGAIKREGIYDAVIKILADCGKNVTELSGIMPNPTAAKVREGVTLCKENNIDFILAVGGGSVIDCCKAIAVGAVVEEDFWDVLYKAHKKVPKALRIGTVLTMVGTGSEMNGNAVITNEEIKVKAGFNSPYVYPMFSILDPTFTYSLPQYQMVSGICDILSHLMELYFSGEDDNVSDDLNEALMKSIVKNARIAVKNPKDYDARSNIMWGATLALNDMLGVGKAQDWEVHQIEHQLGAYYDVAHGMGLAAVSASYYRFICKDGLQKFVKYAVNVWNVDPKGKTDEQTALEGIERLEAFFREIGASTSMRELGIPDKSKLSEIAESTNLLKSGYRTLTHEDVKNILEASF